MDVLTDFPASDADWYALVGGIAAFIALFSRWADIRRLRRRDPDAVGFMPWTAIYFTSLFIACIALGAAGRAWFRH